MPKANPILTNFTAGELSPRLDGRVDIAKYFNGCRRLENMIVLPHGAATRRGGTRFVGSVRDHDAVSRLLPFRFSTTQAYVIEAAASAFRFFRDQGRVVAADTDAVIVNGSFDSDLSSWTAASVTQSAGRASFAAGGTLSQAVSVTDPEVGLVLVFAITGTASTDELTLKLGTTDGGTEIGSKDFGVGWHAHAFTPGAGNASFYIHFARKGGTPALDDVAFLDDAPVELPTPYQQSEIASLYYTQSADVLYLAHEAHPPRKLLRFAHDAWSLVDIAFTDPPAEWTDSDYPGVVGFFEQRLVWARSPSHPQRLWFSKSGNYENHGVSSPVVDDDALSYTIASGQVNAIAWMSPGKQLVLGTVGAEFVAGGAGPDQAISPNSVRIVPETTFGSAMQLPLRIGNAVLFMQAARRKLREMVYSFEVDSHVSPDLTLLAEHISVGGIVQLAYQQEPDSIVWAVRSDGTLLGCTYQRDQDVVAWHRHILGGSDGSGPAAVESTAVIPGDGRDELWLVVRRTIDGNTRRYVEVMQPGLSAEDEQADAFYVDSGLSYNGAPATVISGLDHLEGETLEVLADGARRPPASVSAGRISIDPAASIVHAGLGYGWVLSPMRVEAAAAAGTAQGRAKRIARVTARIYRTLGVEVGAPGQPPDTIHFRTTKTPLGSPPSLYSGDMEISFPHGWDTDGILEISGKGPFPATVIALMPEVRTTG